MVHAVFRMARFTVAAAAAAAVLGTAACSQSGKKTTVVSKARKNALPDSADQRIVGLRTVMQDRGVSKGLLLSDTAFTYEEGTRLELRRVNATFYTSMGLPDGVLTSKAGTYNTRQSRLEARGDVVIVRQDGKRLTSQQVVFDQIRNQVFTDSAFVLNEPDRLLSGIGFESDPQLTNFKCLRACKGVAPVQIPTK